MKKVDKNKLGELMQAVLDAGKELIAPVRQGDHTAYARIKKPGDAALDILLTRMPLKEFFLPKTECLLKYTNLEGGGVEVSDPDPLNQERVVFGARPCDASSLPIMDKVFTWDYNDSLYLARRDKTTIVSIACESPAASCRCESVGISPSAKDGSDVLLTPIGDAYTVDAVTEKGEKLVALWGSKLSDASDADAAKAAAFKPALPGHQTDTASLRGKLKAKFETPAWAEQTMKCVGCGACAYLCPTCHCFDIVDEKSGCGGERRRNWDACAFSTFTLHGSGHNPRAEQQHRYRQRVMHKFDYYPEKFGPVACVGCGRCLSACPVGMDIFEIIEKVTADE
ncbi:MAG TPA: 4Fe-4S dicluster domain-containing protein [bacterium]|nr:4Fe-4S dicluster domain-containing protein [bacterium]